MLPQNFSGRVGDPASSTTVRQYHLDRQMSQSGECHPSEGVVEDLDDSVLLFPKCGSTVWAGAHEAASGIDSVGRIPWYEQFLPPAGE